MGGGGNWSVNVLFVHLKAFNYRLVKEEHTPEHTCESSNTKQWIEIPMPSFVALLVQLPVLTLALPTDAFNRSDVRIRVLELGKTQPKPRIKTPKVHRNSLTTPILIPTRSPKSRRPPTMIGKLI
jgi:hypothetical protein